MLAAGELVHLRSVPAAGGSGRPGASTGPSAGPRAAWGVLTGSARARRSSARRPAPVVAAHAGGHGVPTVEGQVRPLADREDVVGDEPAGLLPAPVADAQRRPHGGREGAPLRALVRRPAAGIVGADPGALARRAARAAGDPAAVEAGRRRHHRRGRSTMIVRGGATHSGSGFGGSGVGRVSRLIFIVSQTHAAKTSRGTGLVPRVRVELTRPCGQRSLSPPRLPVSPPRRGVARES